MSSLKGPDYNAGTLKLAESSKDSREHSSARDSEEVRDLKPKDPPA